MTTKLRSLRAEAAIPVERDELATSLWRLGNYYCSYGGEPELESRCDCKLMPTDESRIRFQSECYCGCPEMHLAAALLRCLTKKEYEALCLKLHRRNRAKTRPLDRGRRKGAAR